METFQFLTIVLYNCNTHLIRYRQRTLNHERLACITISYLRIFSSVSNLNAGSSIRRFMYEKKHFMELYEESFQMKR